MRRTPGWIKARREVRRRDRRDGWVRVASALGTPKYLGRRRMFGYYRTIRVAHSFGNSEQLGE